MADPVYFETSTVIELINAAAKAADIRDLISELQQAKTRIYTSILTVQESSILSFRRGRDGQEVYSAINQFARIYSMDRPIALAAARLEATLLQALPKGAPREDKASHRRRWDCIHIATAQVLGCSVLYAYDLHFLKRSRQIQLGGLRIAEPKPAQPRLSLSNLALVPKPK